MSETEYKFSDLLGQTLIAVEQIGVEEIRFTAVGGAVYKLWHNQDCCESVLIEDVCGDLQDLVGSPILLAEENSNSDQLPGKDQSEGEDGSFTWTFYRLATIKGAVTIRWLGTSNGFYSESVDFSKGDSNV